MYVREIAMQAMQRTQIYLDPELSQALDRLAHQRGTSRSSLIRLAARRFIAEEEAPEEDPIFGIIGIGRSGLSDVSERHDDYLIEDKLNKMIR